jgi:hypothetical protein
MTLDEARQVINDRNSPFARQVEAAAFIASSKRSELSDLIKCLRLGGLPAETAATALYSRTGRPYDGNVSNFSASADDWSAYLANQLQAAVG